MSTWFTQRDAVANRIPARTARFPAKNLLKQKKLEWIIPIGRLRATPIDSTTRRKENSARLDCSAGVQPVRGILSTLPCVGCYIGL